MTLLTATGRRIAALAIGFGAAVAVKAEPITFNFEFNGLAYNNSAKVVGSITFEKTLLTNVSTDSINLRYYMSGPEVLALDMTVTGASSGNGHFGKSDFGFMVWQTNGELDLTKPLIGQPTNQAPWGTTYDRYSGDFNFFSQGSGPNGLGVFQLGADGGLGEAMNLVSMIPVISGASATGVPEPQTYLLTLGGLSIVGLMVSRRSKLNA